MTVNRIWASGILVGTSVYLIFDSLGIGKHPIGDGIWIGALVTMILLHLHGDDE